jgi:FKBP-type peptidyl-prolyl cis-trans isomerase FkpA
MKHFILVLFTLTCLLSVQLQADEVTKKAGEQFLNKNLHKKDVQVTASGLQYLVIKKGIGPKPTMNSTVKVHYVGKFIDGKEFDSSKKRQVPVDLPLKAVIKGFAEGLQLMSPGAHYRLFIPADLAYGKTGAPPKIPGDSVIIFELELLEIKQ